MQGESPDHQELLSALFADEFADGGIDLDALRRIHAGEFNEWTTALYRSGMLGEHAIAILADRWRRDPRSLLDVLIAEADMVTRRRCLMAWSALDHDGSRTRFG